ncbi:flagellar assembly protein FliW [Azonexus sp.]|uniref:flagellar assembly protein FliW n=1 Tax=Azonexus sp. TaxID=1872668 RepID=UPI0027B900B3|nr:flagellar assembly protein FliW [Azonexus sp.]
MKVETYLFGAIEVSPEKTLSFPNGLFAFENNKNFTLVHEEGKGDPASFTLQSLDDPSVAFQIIDPTTLGFHYELELSDEENALLKSPAAEDVAVMIILFKETEGEGTPGINPNLRAPLIINLKERVGVQKLLVKVATNVTLSNLSSAV